MNATILRESSKSQVESLGYKFNPSLPILDPVDVRRSETEVTGRILVVYACVACSYGFPKADAVAWLDRENLFNFATESESSFLRGKSDTLKTTIQWQVEALWSLTWCCSYHGELDFSKPCPESFIKLFPDLKTGESSKNFVSDCKLRSSDEIAEMLDLNYCLHWAVRNSELTSRVAKRDRKVETRVIEERRRGLEWVTSEDDWDEVSLDT